MNDQVQAPLHTSGAVGDYFFLESHLLSTRSADCYRATDKSNNTAVSLWMLRHPLALNSEAARRFMTRLRAIDSIDPPLSQMISYAVDSAGMAFAVLPPFNGQAVATGNIEAVEAERRFLSCVKSVAVLHAAGIVCGDLCGSSFWVDRDGDVQFIGVMGSFDTEAVATAMLPPMDTLHYVAPEQRAGGGIEQASDVFALGVLGYLLFTGKFPYGNQPMMFVGDMSVDQVKPISNFVKFPPIWLEEVLRKCLDPEAGDRFLSAGEILNSITAMRDRAFQDSASPARISGAGPAVARGSNLTLKPGARPGSSSQQKESPAGAKSNLSSRRVLLAGGAVVGLGVIAATLFIDNKPPLPTKLEEDLKIHQNAGGDTSIQQAIPEIGKAEGDLAEKSRKFDELAASDDPLAHGILVQSAVDAPSPEGRAAAEKAVLDRARRLGLMRSAEQVKQWLRTQKFGAVSTSYPAILKILDATLPVEGTNKLLREAYPENPLLVLRLAGGIAVDSEKFDDYQAVIAQLVGDSLKLEDATAHSSLALIMAHPELAIVYGEDVVQKKEKLPDSDVLWLLKILSSRGDSNLRALSNMAVERKILPEIRQDFLAIVRDREDLKPEVVDVLIRAAAGAVKPEDMGAFGRWDDTASEDILLKVMADSTDSKVLSEAFDTIAGKSLMIEPSRSLIEWVRDNAWDNRVTYAPLIGMLPNAPKIDPARLKEEVLKFGPNLKNPRLVDILISSGNSDIVNLLVENDPKALGLGNLLNLLESPMKPVRLSVINALKDEKQLGALKIIIDKYEKEKDPEVRTAYEETFWMIQQRKK